MFDLEVFKIGIGEFYGVVEADAVIAKLQAENEALKAYQKHERSLAYEQFREENEALKAQLFECRKAIELAKITVIANNVDFRNFMKVLNKALAKVNE